MAVDVVHKSNGDVERLAQLKGELLSFIRKDRYSVELFSPNKDPVLQSTYVDVKRLNGYPEVRRTMIEALVMQVPEGVTCIAASGHGGYLAQSIADQLKLKLSIVRKEPKNHHDHGYFDGLPPHLYEKVVMFDDTLAHGSEARWMKWEIEKIEAKPVKFLFVQNRARSEPDLGGIPYFHIFKSDEIFPSRAVSFRGTGQTIGNSEQ